ncbi:MAG: hypothetical protein II840_11970, partial [Kiritimatiellae bacterium]|nr:hypothetical protein [Kiritimatiellia bacterium]
AAFLVGAVLAALHADKPAPVPSAYLRWDRGLADNGSIATNDTVFIRGTYDQLMANDTLHIDYRDRASTNALDWVRAYNGVVSDLGPGITMTIVGATNMVIWVWSEYVPPAPVHTNGEYRITYVGSVTNSPPETPRYVLPRTPVKTAEGVQLSPPELPEPQRTSLFSILASELLQEQTP